MSAPSQPRNAGQSVGTALAWGTARLAEVGVETPALDARLLLADAAGLDRGELFLARERGLQPAAWQRFRDHIAGRAKRRPVSRLLGRRGFWSLDLKIDDSVLDPRPDSESLVEAVLELVDARGDRDAPYRLLDLGIGSGCLLLALLAELPAAHGVGVDRSVAAVACAHANAARLGLGRRATFLVGDWGRPLDGDFDVIVSNPPYIAEAELAALSPEVREHDPALALIGGVDGLDGYRRLAPDLSRLLAADGVGFVECGRGQAAAVAAVLMAAGLESGGAWPDLGGATRCISVHAAHLKRRGAKKVLESAAPEARFTTG